MTKLLRPVPIGKWEKYLQSKGFVRKRQKASHIIYQRTDKPLKRPLVFQADKEISPYIIKSNLRDLGISLSDFYKDIKSL
ncbi:MAG: type II toxin-antitoxin system HicA family toxin [Patescibacteria group bacterium]|nr:type II toxin-antitoxin system HicA family toxin [Patescibacteria group bacterium]MBU1953141.1 type II toxin-antitoxin system HicA family toxin [Patescibacteria group bacterium]